MEHRIENLGALLNDASRAVRRRFEYLTAEHGLSVPQWRLLRHILINGPCNQTILADLLDVEPISVSRMIDRMEQAGWLKREAHPDDRRARIIVPTDKARLVAPEARATAETVYAEALSGLSDSQRHALQTALLAIASNLSKPDTAALRRESETAQ
ncbi:MarR family transcriptional regulator (plasmid) [Gemmobacter aquarius]|uniref:MarR family transcriptional regulator n=1 Tax=Paragemmobacter aquarius TaxID=2169400 RepID=A0A2S0URR3_9RHOB|nr:MarR family transcriptional regulator [Gemmobacter aquarius]